MLKVKDMIKPVTKQDVEPDLAVNTPFEPDPTYPDPPSPSPTYPDPNESRKGINGLEFGQLMNSLIRREFYRC